MDFFALTKYGFSDSFKDLMRPDYKEPQQRRPMSEPEDDIPDGTAKKPFAEAIKELDCYIGSANGYAFNSHERLRLMRHKYMFKPVGPCRMYRYPGTNAMNYGWWKEDPELVPLLEDNWHLPLERFPRQRSEMSRFLDYCMKVDKFFRM